MRNYDRYDKEPALSPSDIFKRLIERANDAAHIYRGPEGLSYALLQSLESFAQYSVVPLHSTAFDNFLREQYQLYYAEFPPDSALKSARRYLDRKSAPRTWTAPPVSLRV